MQAIEQREVAFGPANYTRRPWEREKEVKNRKYILYTEFFPKIMHPKCNRFWLITFICMLLLLFFSGGWVISWSFLLAGSRNYQIIGLPFWLTD